MCFVVILLVFFCSPSLIGVAFVSGVDSTQYAGRDHQNSVALTFSDFVIPKLKPHIACQLLRQPGINYERKISSKCSVGISYSQWTNIPKTEGQSGFLVFASNTAMQSALHGFEDFVDKTEFRTNAKMADVYLVCHWLHMGRHFISSSIGITVVREEDHFINPGLPSIEYFNLANSSGYSSAALLFQNAAIRNYIGILPRLQYDYLISGRISVGADLDYRKYFGINYGQFEYGCHIASSF